MTTTKQKKNSKLRYLEYYDLQDTLDMLYADSGRRKIFNNLMPLIESEENIRLAYRNIKRNSGSNTSGVDKLTIKDIEKIPENLRRDFVRPLILGDFTRIEKLRDFFFRESQSGVMPDMVRKLSYQFRS